MDRITKLAIKDIAPNPHNIRAELTDIKELASSIAFMGLLQPIRVDKEGKIIAGHRRREALDYLIQHYDEWTEDTVVECVVGNKMDEQTETAAMLVENMQRVDLPIQDQVEGVRRLMQEYAWTQAEVAKNLGVTKKWVEQRVHIQGTPLEAFQGDREFTVEQLAQFGQLPEKVKEKLVSKSAEKGISAYDIEDRFSKMKSEERMQKQLRKFQKDGQLATTEAEVKRIMKTQLENLEPHDQLIKTATKDAKTITTYEWTAPKTSSSILLKQIFGDIAELPERITKDDLLVASKSGGFWRWYEIKHIKAKPPIDSDDYDAERAELERIDAAREEMEIAAIKNRVEEGKPAHLITDVLWAVIRDGLTSFSPDPKIRKAAAVLGLTIEELPDLGDLDFVEQRDARAKFRNEAMETITSYAVKNNTNLARTAATVLMVGDRADNLVENWNIDQADLTFTPLETGV